jgi:hypothetical protein
MRILTVLLSVVLIASALVAEPEPISPETEGPSVENSLKFINQRMYISQDRSEGKCRDTIQLSLSDDRAEILIKYFVVDGRDRIKENVAPKFIYHIPVEAVRSIYATGPWTTHDRILVRTYGRAVTKYGPVWDCGKEKLNDKPKKGFIDSVDLRVQDPDDGRLSGVQKALNHVVDLLKAEQDAKAASQPGDNHDSGKDKKDSSPDNK